MVATRDTDSVCFPFHRHVNIVQVPLHVMALQFTSQRHDVIQSLQLDALGIRLHLVERIFIFIEPGLGNTLVVVHNSRHLDVVRAMRGIAEEMADSRAWNHFDVPSTPPDFHGGLDVVATPTNHAFVVELQSLPPVLPNCEDTARCRRRRNRLHCPNVILPGGRRVDQIEVPFESPNAFF